MKFFMLSKCGEGAGLLKRIQDEGNDCSIFIKEKEYSSIYDGILKKSTSPDNGAVIIVDSSGMGKESDKYKKQGFSVFGGSVFSDDLEQDRDFGFEYMKTHDIQTPETKEFFDFSTGLEYVKSKKDKKLVFKPSGDNIPCKLTYCAEDSGDMCSYMDYVERYFGKDIKSFVLQDFIEGALISTEFWVGKNGLIEPANHTVEVKKFLNDDLGPSTGCQGNLVWVVKKDDIVVKHLRELNESLISNNFVGCIDLNAIVNEDGIFGLEWTPRFGLDAMPTLLQLMKDDVGKLIYEACEGTVQEMNGLVEEFAGGVRLSIPPYPAEPESPEKLDKQVPSKGIPIRYNEQFENNFYFYEVSKNDDELIHAAGTGVIAVVSDYSDNLDNVFVLPYHILEETKLQDKQYRTDIKEVLTEMYSDSEEILNVTIRS